ncbi:hypothetical protein RJ639_008347 [Escallonia herrerae]|uniref:WPP domain-interacting protein 2 n=1 Tax=Escallonia herrerae TaxID=1293975 RepID=A0AA88VTZ6_9ASTE|nr:hypothetical protein RJ639_008347 [Escallonia herrerae]
MESAEDNEESVANSNGSHRVESIDSKLEKSPLMKGQSPVGGSPSTAKGYGLKKWRRIKREVVADGGSNVDSGKVLKRGLSSSQPGSNRANLEMKQKSEGSVSSTNAFLKSRGAVGDGGFAMQGDIGIMGGLHFAADTDSENSEDRSSKLSTAASAPRTRYEIPAGDKNRTRNLSGKGLGSPVQRGQQGKGRIETSKKHRGERVKIEKENSHSSMESDSRSSNFVFMQGNNSVTSNGRQSRRLANYDGENSDDAQGGEQHFDEQTLPGFRKNGAEFENVSQEDLTAEPSWEIKEEESENHGSSAGRDPLVESIITLQSAQEALEKEVEKLKEIGKEDVLFDESVQASSLPSEADHKVHESSSSFQFGETEQNSSHSLETQLTSLKRNISTLENQLEEARAMLEVKEAKVSKLEDRLNTGETIELQQRKCIEMETELEGLFKQKIETEIEYLAISETIQKWRVAAINPLTVLEGQKALRSEQAHTLNKLEDAESHAAMLKIHAEKLEAYCGDIARTGEVLKLQKRACKLTSCFFIQLILLIVVLGLFVLQLSPHYAGVVPT